MRIRSLTLVQSEARSVGRMSPTRPHTKRRELSARRAGGLEVVLYWHEGRGDMTVAVRDADTGEAFELNVEPANALDAFRHPYAYAARRGIS